MVIADVASHFVTVRSIIASPSSAAGGTFEVIERQLFVRVLCLLCSALSVSLDKFFGGNVISRIYSYL